MSKKAPEAIWFRESHVTIVADADSTDGRLSVIDTRLPANSAPPLHRHPNDETFHVLEGEVAFLVDSSLDYYSAGECAFVPRDTPHAFRVLSPEARILVVCTPAGHEDLFRRGGDPAPSDSLPPFDPPGDMPRLAAAAASVGAEILGPPPPELAGLALSGQEV